MCQNKIQTFSRKMVEISQYEKSQIFSVLNLNFLKLKNFDFWNWQNSKFVSSKISEINQKKCWFYSRKFLTFQNVIFFLLKENLRLISKLLFSFCSISNDPNPTSNRTFSFLHLSRLLQNINITVCFHPVLNDLQFLFKSSRVQRKNT